MAILANQSMTNSRAHEAMSIGLYQHAGVLKSFESDERRRLQRAFDIFDETDRELDPYYSELWRGITGDNLPSNATRAKCHLGTLPRLHTSTNSPSIYSTAYAYRPANGVGSRRDVRKHSRRSRHTNGRQAHALPH